MKFRQVAAVVLISASTAVGSVWTYNRIAEKSTYQYQASNPRTPINYAGFVNGGTGAPAGTPVDFTEAAAASVPATVHIKTKTNAKPSNNLPSRRSPFSDLFGDWDDLFGGDGLRSRPQQASGSGAIISEDGYIVTNNHVIEGADNITVTLSNRKSFQAKLVGTDPSSDLAVIKIDAKGLPFMLYGNSDEVKIGQWVLAIGYPLNLETTVTAGIVSAKSRTLDINRRNNTKVSPVESFIQTDAAVNPGNSGGPLVSTDGKLIGINSAIASPTGSYAGYSFTIPVNIVQKVMADLVKFGTVQRAYLGIEYAPESVTEDQKKEQGIKDGEGVYVMRVQQEGAALAAGIQKGDFITKVNGVPVYSGADMVGQIATYRPGDKITITYNREGKEHTTNLTFRNSAGTTEIVKTSVLDKLGANLETVSKKSATEMGIKGGVVVKSFTETSPFSKTRMEEGYVITRVNDKEVLTLEAFRNEIEKSSGNVKLDGVYPGFNGTFSYPLRLNTE
ncbi:MAG: trypsin-like peptidase domain-containing protein [Williamsia sp.]|nr:trypsin-like peptidase domain-containing protein [Williamsia sp.]